VIKRIIKNIIIKNNKNLKRDNNKINPNSHQSSDLNNKNNKED